MKKLVLIVIIIISFHSANSQIRNGWRSIYDNEGRLTRMYYYQNGLSIVDSSRFFQYYTENFLKALVKGEINSQKGFINGSVSLFDELGKLTSFNNGKEGESFFYMECDFYQDCIASWNDRFMVGNNFWKSDSLTIANGELIVHNSSGAIGFAVYDPLISVDLRNEFICKLEIPIDNYSSKQGLALGWLDAANYYLIELSFHSYYTVHHIENGVTRNITRGRIDLERPGEKTNTLQVRKTDRNLIIEWNGVIQSVFPIPDLKGEKIAVVTRSRGDMHLSEFALSYSQGAEMNFVNDLWVGKGTGFFITPNRILTTYDNVADVNSLRIKAEIDGKKMILPASIFRLEENHNLAILSVDVPGFRAFNELPFGYLDRAPLTESMVFSVGYPNAISGMHLQPDMFQGKTLQGSTLAAGYRMLEMPFRYGMSGSPVFDNDANLIGVNAMRGMDLRYTEMIDFHNNRRLFMANLGKFDQRIESPLRQLTQRERIQKLSELVVIIESSVFQLDN